MAVDRGYGSGKPRSAANSASRRAAAGKAASRKKTVTAAAKQYGQKKGMSYTNPGMLASQKKRMTLDNRRTSDSLLENLTGFNKKDGVDAGDFAGLAISIPTGGVGGALLRAGARAVIPKAARIAGAATRVSRVARGTRRNIAEPLNAARNAVTSELENVVNVGSRAYSNYLKMERRIGSGPTDMLYGSEGKYIQRAKDEAYKGVNQAAEKATRLERLAERAAERSDILGSTEEIKRRLAALKRANRNR